jgi:hypothetical protein
MKFQSFAIWEPSGAPSVKPDRRASWRYFRSQSKERKRMKAVRYLAPVLIISGIALSPALAAPVAAPAAVDQTAGAPLIQVQDHRDDHGHGGQHYVAGRRYHSAPHGWHRFDRRPGDWHARNCVMVGPVWFCP